VQEAGWHADPRTTMRHQSGPAPSLHCESGRRAGSCAAVTRRDLEVNGNRRSGRLPQAVTQFM